MTAALKRIGNIGRLVTMDASRGAGALGVIEGGALAWKGERILWAGAGKELPAEYQNCAELDAGGALVTPGLVDCHTHLLFGGSRSDEFFARLGKETYETIAGKGGGIASTVSATAASSDEELLSCAERRLDRFLRFGVTTVEIKSGYGLSVERELRILRLIGGMDHAVDVVPTFLGAHAVPLEFRTNRSEYVRLVCDVMLPKVKAEGLSGFCDVFCDEGAFSVDEAREILNSAAKLGFRLKVHADQLKGTGAAELAGEMGAVSAEHLEMVSDAGIRALAEAGTVAVLLPGAVVFLGKSTYPPARRLIEAGVRVAISTDTNPGTSLTENLPLMMTFAATHLKMTAAEIWSAVTTHAAAALALSDRGVLAPGMRADFVVWDALGPEEIPYRFGSVEASAVWCGGVCRRKESL